MARQQVYPASIHESQAHVELYAEQLHRDFGKDHVVISVPKGSAAYHMGYRWTTCPRAELPDYIAGGAKLATTEAR